MPITRRKAVVTVIGIVLIGWWMLLPPPAQPTPAWQSSSPIVRGAYHIHSDRSDGSGSVEDIAKAAADAGLKFIILTDHGDGTRTASPPAYLSGVLVIDAVEISTTRGHYAALGVAEAPYPIAGEPADVIEDVRRLGGFGFIAHPDSPRVSLAWQDFHARFDGLEWLNTDTGWRDESRTRLVRTLATYLVRAPESLATLLDRPAGLLARWDALGQTRRVPAIAAADAHARIGLRQDTDPDFSAVHAPLPSYRASFRTFSNHVAIRTAMSGNAAPDAALVLEGIREGGLFTVVDALATPGGLSFTIGSGPGTAGMGEDVALDGDVFVKAAIAAPANTRLVVLRNSEPVHRSESGVIDWNAGATPGVYRIEAYLPGGGAGLPWILSNPIYVGLPRERVEPTVPAVIAQIDARVAEATTESGVGDSSTIVPDAKPIEWQFGLGAGPSTGHFAAIRLPVVTGLELFERVRFRVSASQPMRLRVQLRSRDSGERWGRTFYADADPRLVDLALGDFLPIGSATLSTPPSDRVDSILFVVDTLNTRTGSQGRVNLQEIAFVR